MEGENTTYNLVLCSYYAFTTLSTVGYGDYYPVNTIERIVVVFFMVGGVGFFSYIMGNFIEILTSYEKKMGVENKEPDLYAWMAIIDRFTSQPIQQNLGK